jgi:hypothetical protein
MSSKTNPTQYQAFLMHLPCSATRSFLGWSTATLRVYSSVPNKQRSTAIGAFSIRVRSNARCLLACHLMPTTTVSKSQLRGMLRAEVCR